MQTGSDDCVVPFVDDDLVVIVAAADRRDLSTPAQSAL